MNTYYETTCPNTLILHITGNKHEGEILIDSEDFEKLSKHSWVCQVRVNGKSYVKSFSVKKFGEIKAKQLAEKALDNFRKEFNVLSE